MPIIPGLTGFGRVQNGPTITCAISGPFVAGQSCVVGISIADPNISVVSLFSDTNGGSMVFSSLVDPVILTNARLELWGTTVMGTKNGGSFLNVNLSGPAYASATLACNSGVGAYGTTGMATAVSTNPTVSAVMHGPNNVIVAAFLTEGSTLPIALTGVVDRSIFSGP